MKQCSFGNPNSKSDCPLCNPTALRLPEFSPVINSNVITLVRQEDGNYIGYAQKNGDFIQVRDRDPESVLVAIITHK